MFGTMKTSLKTRVILIFCFTSSVLSAPPISSTESLVVLSTEAPKEEIVKSDKDAIDKSSTPLVIPKIYEMRVDTNVTNRFANTVVTSRVKNLNQKAQEATFSVVLPETAYISGFVMEISGKSYTAYVKEKEEAKKIYDEAVSTGIAAAHVEANARDSNRFTVSTNIEPESKAVFYLTYQELLQRQNGKYDIVINIHPGQPVKDLNVEVNINETRPLKFVKVPSLRSGNEISKNEEKLDPKAQVEMINSTAAKVKFNPDIQRQKEFAANLGTKEDNGLAGQFIVEYDVERDPQGGEILVSDGYFVHFFAPSNLEPLKKHVVFVLDTSGSMWGTRIAQLKEAMKSILKKLKKGDTFNIIDFNSVVNAWNIPKVEIQYVKADTSFNYYTPKVVEVENKTQILPDAFNVDDDNIKQAEKVVEKLTADGGTDILSSIEIGLQLINNTKQGETGKYRQPIIIFLTDGDPTSGETDTGKIISKLSELNINKVPIFSLSFGDGADRSFLEKLSLRNQGFARHIYEGADASLQLQAFYKYISSPLLSNVHFKYVSKSVEKLTKTKFPIFFDGAEFVVAGKFVVDPNVKVGDVIDPGFNVGGWGIHGPINLNPKFENPVGSLEKHWAYLTVKQILEDRDAAENKTELTKKALDVALKYSFVTPVSSLVVVKPNDTKAEADPEDASKGSGYDGAHFNKLAFLPAAPSFDTGSVYSSAAFPAAGGFGGGGGAGSFVPLSALSTPFRYPPTSVPPPSLPPLATSVSPADSASKVPESANTTDASLTINSIDDLKKHLPWIEQSLGKNGLLKLSSGEFDLGFNSTNISHPECPKTPLNEAGECTLLKDCPQVFTLLTDEKTYSKFFCALDKNAGVCCPKLKP